MMMMRGGQDRWILQALTPMGLVGVSMIFEGGVSLTAMHMWELIGWVRPCSCDLDCEAWRDGLVCAIWIERGAIKV